MLLKSSPAGLAIRAALSQTAPCCPPCLQELSDSCRTGAATNVIFGLALGYKSAIVPCLVIATCIFVSFTLAHMFGIACAALGFLTTLSTGELM